MCLEDQGNIALEEIYKFVYKKYKTVEREMGGGVKGNWQKNRGKVGRCEKEKENQQEQRRENKLQHWGREIEESGDGKDEKMKNKYYSNKKENVKNEENKRQSKTGKKS